MKQATTGSFFTDLKTTDGTFKNTNFLIDLSN